MSALLSIVFVAVVAAVVCRIAFGSADAGRSAAFPETDEGVVLALREGKKITAIKIYRKLHSLGLKEAKLAVERIEKELRAERDGMR